MLRADFPTRTDSRRPQTKASVLGASGAPAAFGRITAPHNNLLIYRGYLYLNPVRIEPWMMLRAPLLAIG